MRTIKSIKEEAMDFYRGCDTEHAILKALEIQRKEYEHSIKNRKGGKIKHGKTH